MGAVNLEVDIPQQHSADPVPFARSYQLEALEKSIKQNTIAFLETGSGKTLIAIMLLRSYAYLIRKPSKYYAVFLVPKVVLVKQQADAVELHTDLKVGKYWGDMGVDLWDGEKWKQEIDKYEVLVMTPQILLNGLRHSFFKINMIKVLVIDECHHAQGKHPYASIMIDFYHRQLKAGVSDLPRIFGMTASPINSKGANLDGGYWRAIHELETIMNSKVYTCESEQVFVPFSTPKFKFYQHLQIPDVLYAHLEKELNVLKEKHECSLEKLDLEASVVESTKKRISKLHSALTYCLDELGAWLALKAAEYLSCSESEFLMWEKLDVFGEQIVRSYSLDVFHAIQTCIPSGPHWSIANDIKASVDAGFLTTKVLCLVESLSDYRSMTEIRCIIFVERVITAVVLKSLFCELLPKSCSWQTEYIAGYNCRLRNQSRKEQNEIVEEFRKGMVNVIVATSILEEGLDVQACNLIIRFDPSPTVCSFIQSRGRARMQNSDYLLIVKSGDFATHSRLENYLTSGDVMRKESLSHASNPCSPLSNDLYDEEFYHVASTGACMTLSSSVGLLYFYCSRLPADGYFKPNPRFIIDKQMGICTLHLPKSSPIRTVCIYANNKILKQKGCFEACKQLHQVGALTDNLVPDVVVEENDAEDIGKEPYNDDQPIFFPPDLVNMGSLESKTAYYCYLMELKQNFDYAIPVHNIMLLVRSPLDMDEKSVGIELEVDRGTLTVNLNYVGPLSLVSEQVILCRRFQIAVLQVLRERKVEKLTEVLHSLTSGNNSVIDYILLPSNHMDQNPRIDWESVCSIGFSYDKVWNNHVKVNCNAGMIMTKSGLICTCMIQNSLVSTPHNGHTYIINGFLNNINANSLLSLRDGSVTYKEYYEQRYGIHLCFTQVSFLQGRHIFPLQNHLQRCRKQKEKESSNAFVELPAELCDVIMSPISISTFYSFTFVPSIMHRLESLFLATSLKRMYLDHSVQNVAIPTMKVLEAITTKKCLENFHLESLETLGDSFLKYTVCKQLFKKHQNHHEGLLSIKKDKIVSNKALCMLGCDKKLPGFIRDEPFDPKSWMIPGCSSGSYTFIEETLCNNRKIHVCGRRKLKSKRVADVVEALIGAYLSMGGEGAALLFMNWIGLTIDFTNIPYERHFRVQAEKLVSVRCLESLLNYSFQDPSLLVEALTHGSYMVVEIPGCYQRLEFLGDAVLDYLVTMHLYKKFPGISPGLLTDLRSASVNNNCYALSAVRAGLHKHILHSSQKLFKHIKETVESFQASPLEFTFGWGSEKSFPKVLGDVMESLAGAIFVDSGYDKEAVFRSIRPLLEPMITPETMTVNPVKELNELCQRQHYEQRKPVVSHNNGVSSTTVEVEANGRVIKHTSTASDKIMAKRLASKEVLKILKESDFS